MFSRHGLFKYLPAFLVPSALRAEEPLTQKQLEILAVSLPLPELKILIENLHKLEMPKRHRRKDEALSSFQHQFPSTTGKILEEEKKIDDPKEKLDSLLVKAKLDKLKDDLAKLQEAIDKKNKV